MRFYTYMMRNHLGKVGPAGDLAADMKDDKEYFPKNGPEKFSGWHKLIRKHLETNEACQNCLETFEECWEEYVKCVKKK